MDMNKNNESKVINFTDLEISMEKYGIMCFIYNVVEDGWSIKKENNNYIVSKKGVDERQKMDDDNYLEEFVYKYINLKSIKN